MTSGKIVGACQLRFGDVAAGFFLHCDAACISQETLGENRGTVFVIAGCLAKNGGQMHFIQIDEGSRQ